MENAAVGVFKNRRQEYVMTVVRGGVGGARGRGVVRDGCCGHKRTCFGAISSPGPPTWDHATCVV